MGAGGPAWVRTGGNGRTSGKHTWLTREPFHNSTVLRKMPGGSGGGVPGPSETTLWAWGCQEHTCPRSDSEPQSFPLSSVPLPRGVLRPSGHAVPQALAGRRTGKGAVGLPSGLRVYHCPAVRQLPISSPFSTPGSFLPKGAHGALFTGAVRKTGDKGMRHPVCT